MASRKMTFTLDEGTVGRIDRAAKRLGVPKSRVVREAIREYAEQVGRLGDDERRRMLSTFDEVVEQIPRRSLAAVKREITDLRRVRRGGGRGGARAR